MAKQNSGRIAPNRMDDFFTLDFRTGSIINQLTEQRVQVFPVLRWAKIEKELTRQLSDRAQIVISIIGFTLGSSLAEEMMSQISEPEALTKLLSDVMAAAGWGVFSFVGDAQYGSKLVVSVANCGFCDKEKELSATPQCDFLVAALKGIADKVYGTPHRVREERCAAKGDPFCQFQVEECKDAQLCPECRNLRYCEFLQEQESLPNGRANHASQA